MSVRESVADIVGKTISSVVITKNIKTRPRGQLILVFSDGTSYEFWVDTDEISSSRYVVPSSIDQIIKPLSKRPDTEIRIFRAPHEDPNSVQRDLLADKNV